MENISGLETVSFSRCEITLKRRPCVNYRFQAAFLGAFASQSFQRCQNKILTRQYRFVPAHMLKNDNKMVCACAECLECGLSAHQSSVSSRQQGARQDIHLYCSAGT